MVYLPYLITLDDIVSQIAVAGFKAFVKSKPRPLQLSISEVERLLGAPKSTLLPLAEASGDTKTSPVSAQTTLRVTGMHCYSCVVNIQDNVAKLPGVSTVEVFLEKEKASISYNPHKVTVPQLQQAIEALPPGSFKTQAWGSTGALSPTSTSPTPPLLSPPPPPAVAATQAQLTAPQPCISQPLLAVAQIHIEGMTCGSCVQSIEGMLSQRKGVRSAQVSLANHRGAFEYDPLLTTPEELRDAIEDMGFDAFLPGKFIRIFSLKQENYFNE